MLPYKVSNLVYVPNSYCNLGCKYCYLGTATDKVTENMSNITSQLKIILDSALEEGVLFPMISLHGAEITTVPKKYLEELFAFITDYFEEHKTHFRTLTDKTPEIHIKTNLYNFDTLYDVMDKYKVTVSASFDLPFSQHDKYRVTKKGKSTLDKTLSNIKLLKNYPHGRGLSCVATKETLANIDDFIRDYKIMQDEIGWDMINRFYIMFAYDSLASYDKFGVEKPSGTSMLNQDELVIFYNKMKEAFVGTKYEDTLYYHMFKEFLPGYCTFMSNCGADQLLVQKDGNCYPCHRTQLDQDFHYGNIFELGYKKIMENAFNVIEAEENKLTISEDCMKCDYFQHCQMNCTLVRKETNMSKAYTCSLQLELYKDQPLRYPADKKEAQIARDIFIRQNNVETAIKKPELLSINPPFEMNNSKYGLGNIIKENPELRTIYEYGQFMFSLNNLPPVKLHNGIFGIDYLITIKSTDKVFIYIKEEQLYANLHDHINTNEFIASFFRHEFINYGLDERDKMMHLGKFIKNPDDIIASGIITEGDAKGYYKVDISSYIHSLEYKDGIETMMDFTTLLNKDMHYKFHKMNAFYHLQAVNHPYHNLNYLYVK